MTKNYVAFVGILTLCIVALSFVLLRSLGALLPLLALPFAAWLGYSAKLELFKLKHTHPWSAFFLVMGGAFIAGLGAVFKVEVLWAVGLAMIFVQPFASCVAVPYLRSCAR